jgi:hypothetical protein
MMSISLFQGSHCSADAAHPVGVQGDLSCHWKNPPRPMVSMVRRLVGVAAASIFMGRTRASGTASAPMICAALTDPAVPAGAWHETASAEVRNEPGSAIDNAAAANKLH